MSTPVRGPDGPLGYAPRWARGSGSGHADTALDVRGARSSTPVQELPLQLDSKPPRVITSARDPGTARDIVSEPDTGPPQDAASEWSVASAREPASFRDSKPSRAPRTATVSAADSVWKRKKRREVFEGDAALRELRSRLASAPDQMPEPPLYQAKTPIFAAVVRLMGIVVLATAGALGFLWLTAPHGQVANQPAGEVALVSYRGLEAPQPSPAAENIKAERGPDAPSSGASWAAANYTPTVTDGVGTPPAALTPRMPPAPRAPAAIRVTTPSPAAPGPVAVAPPPAAPVPASKVPVPAIVAPLLAPSPPASATAAPDRDEIAALLVRARNYLSAGDVAAARLVLRRAAERDDPQAALALGGTYDPSVLKRLGIINYLADPAQAREWYRKAAELGSPDASLRLDQLVQTDR
jgi:hypothetical protein